MRSCECPGSGGWEPFLSCRVQSPTHHIPCTQHDSVQLFHAMPNSQACDLRHPHLEKEDASPASCCTTEKQINDYKRMYIYIYDITCTYIVLLIFTLIYCHDFKCARINVNLQLWFSLSLSPSPALDFSRISPN